MSITLDEIKDRVLDKLNERVIPVTEIGNAILKADQSLSISFPSTPEGADHWKLYSTSHGHEPQRLFSMWNIAMNPHPWLNDLRVMQQMLEGLIKIPHLPKLSGNSHQRRIHRRAIERGECVSHGCITCLKAYRQRNEYNKSKMT